MRPAAAAMNASGVDAAGVARCVDESGGVRADAENWRLECELAERAAQHVVSTPLVVVGGTAVKATLTPTAAMEAICAGYARRLAARRVRVLDEEEEDDALLACVARYQPAAPPSAPPSATRRARAPRVVPPTPIGGRRAARSAAAPDAERRDPRPSPRSSPREGGANSTSLKPDDGGLNNTMVLLVFLAGFGTATMIAAAVAACYGQSKNAQGRGSAFVVLQGEHGRPGRGRASGLAAGRRRR